MSFFTFSLFLNFWEFMLNTAIFSYFYYFAFLCSFHLTLCGKTTTYPTIPKYVDTYVCTWVRTYLSTYSTIPKYVDTCVCTWVRTYLTTYPTIPKYVDE
jgi:hypothetical protein